MSIAKLIDFLKENKEHLVVPPSLDEALERLSKAKGEDKESSRNWAARSDYTDEQSKAMRGFMEQGYSPREAERMADAHENKTMNYDKALKGNIDPSVPSEKMRAELQELAKHWLTHADKYERANADKAKNPVMYAAGKMEQAQEAATSGYKAAYSDFLSSDDMKGKSGRDRHKAIRNWKKQYREDNPDHEEGLNNLSETQKEYEDAHQASKHNLQEKIDHITRGGQGGTEPEQESNDDMSDIEQTFQSAQSGGPTQSAQAASQLAGGTGGGGEGAAPTTSMIKPEEVSFAEKNEKLMGMLNAEQKDRHLRTASAKKAQEQQAAPEPEPQAEAPKPTVIRRRKPGGQ